jgi:hypothetical protein
MSLHELVPRRSGLWILSICALTDSIGEVVVRVLAFSVAEQGGPSVALGVTMLILAASMVMRGVLGIVIAWKLKWPVASGNCRPDNDRCLVHGRAAGDPCTRPGASSTAGAKPDGSADSTDVSHVRSVWERLGARNWDRLRRAHGARIAFVCAEHGTQGLVNPYEPLR